MNALNSIDVRSIPLNYKDDDFDPGEYTRKEILPKLNLHLDQKYSNIIRTMGDLLENLHPWHTLRLLAENEKNLDIPVIWYYADVVEEGYNKIEKIHASLAQEARFLIVTEGNTDTLILKKSFSLLRNKISDFFTFIDMEENYPFTGVGQLHNFCQGLVKIGISNKILVIYDNDTEGTAKFLDTKKLVLPDNMKIIRLPSLNKFEKFNTIGPSGHSLENINSKAVAIECFLDLGWHTSDKPMVRWTGYNSKINNYQGELLNKKSYMKKFLSLKRNEKGYDFTKLEHLIDEIYNQCVSISTNAYTNWEFDKHI